MVKYPIWYNKSGLEIIHDPMRIVSNQLLSQVTTHQTKLPEGTNLILKTIPIPDKKITLLIRYLLPICFFNK